jgi:nitrogen regulatory protein P-II 1|tara:strand:- start:226 stop:570 length:345 start_codon:yes stop_codon:yes gene_type:complete
MQQNIMLKLEIILSENDVMSISESLKEINIGGLTITKVRGRGEKTAPEILVHKGSEVFVPHFGDKYRIMVVIPESKEERTVNIIKNNSRGGKIFISQLLRAIDIETGNEGEEII